MNHNDFTKITSISNGADILGILESRGFEYLGDGSNNFWDFFYFRRSSTIAKVLVGTSDDWETQLNGICIFREIFNLESLKENLSDLPAILYNRNYIDPHDVEEFSRQLDSALQFEDKYFVMDTFERHSKNFSKSETLDYLENCFARVKEHYVDQKFTLA